MEQPLIWIVDCEHWPRSALRAELIERGYEAVGHVTLDEALSRLRAVPVEARPRAIVMDLRGQEINPGVLRELIQSSIPTIILGGMTELSDALIQEHRWAAVMKRPILLGEIADRIEKMVPAPGHSSESP